MASNAHNKFAHSTQQVPPIPPARPPLTRGNSPRPWTTSAPPPRRFQWYCRFFLGRRSADDLRQIDRWNKVAGVKGRWRRNLIAKVVKENKSWDDASVSPVVRQTLLHWAYELTEADMRAHAAAVAGR